MRVSVCLMLGWICAAAPPAEDRLSRYEFAQVEMGVPFKVLLYAPDETTANRAAKAAFERIGQLNQILSDYDPKSELSRLSSSSPTIGPVAVSDPLWEVLSRGQALAAESSGAFDVTVGPYVRLWRRARRAKELPSAERLAEARAATGYQALRLHDESQSVELLKPNMRLDLGGIAIGYAVDEALRVLRQHGVTRALIDASGDIGVGDPPPGKTAWRIGIAPLSPDGPPSRYLLLSNAAVTNSGDAFQHVEIDGQRYSHIVDPRTGLGLTDRSSVTVVARDCLTADSLATAVSVLGPKAGLELVEKVPDAAALIVRTGEQGPEVFESQRFKKLTIEPNPTK